MCKRVEGYAERMTNLILKVEKEWLELKEISFNNKRLQEIMGLSKPFGGVNIIAIGDLFQLKPVMDAWVFKDTFVGRPEILAPNMWKENFQMFELSDIVLS